MRVDFPLLCFLGLGACRIGYDSRTLDAGEHEQAGRLFGEVATGGHFGTDAETEGGSASVDASTSAGGSGSGDASAHQTSTGGASASGGDPAGGGASKAGGASTSDSGTAGAGTSGNEGDAGNETGTVTGHYCEALPYLATAPSIDGVIEQDLTLAFLPPVSWRDATTPLPSGNELRFAVAWRPNGLYFYLEVMDPNRNPAPAFYGEYGGDCVELFVDHDGLYETSPPYYDSVGTRQFLVAAPANDTQPSTRATIRAPTAKELMLRPWTSSRWASLPIAEGYVVEAFIAAVDLDLATWSLAAGQTVGFDLAHDVSVAPGQFGVDANRLSQYFLKIRALPDGTDQDYPFTNESVFCSAVLLAP